MPTLHFSLPSAANAFLTSRAEPFRYRGENFGVEWLVIFSDSRPQPLVRAIWTHGEGPHARSIFHQTHLNDRESSEAYALHEYVFWSGRKPPRRFFELAEKVLDSFINDEDIAAEPKESV